MYVTIDETLVKVTGETAVVNASDFVLNLSDGSKVKASTEASAQMGLSKSTGKWLVVSDK
jgi:hypothetical protein